MPRKPERFQNADFEQKERKSIKKPVKTCDFDVPVEPPAMECCRHRASKASRKFICNFAPSSASCVNQCLEMERARCSAFWKLIDQRPELESLMRTGEFEHVNLPHIVEPRKPKDTSVTCENAEELRAKNKALHDEERRRVNNRMRILEELQKKSGQPVRKGKLLDSKSARKKGAGELEPITDFAQLVLEMNAFDKLVHNPVRTAMNPPSATSLEWVHPDLRRLSGQERKLSIPLFEEGESSGEEQEIVDTGEQEIVDNGNGRENDVGLEFGEDNEEVKSGISGESIGGVEM